MQLYKWLLIGSSVMKRSRLCKKKYKVYSLRRKESAMELSPVVLKEIKNFKKSLMLSRIKGVVNPGQESMKLSFQLLKND